MCIRDRFSVGCFVTVVVSLEVPRRRLSEVRSVEVLISDKSGHSKRSDDRPTVKILTIVIRAQNGHAECSLNWNVYNICVSCEFQMTSMQKMNVIAKSSGYFSAVSLH